MDYKFWVNDEWEDMLEINVSGLDFVPPPYRHIPELATAKWHTIGTVTRERHDWWIANSRAGFVCTGDVWDWNRKDFYSRDEAIDWVKNEALQWLTSDTSE